MYYGQVEGTEIVVVDKRFEACFAGHVRVERLWTGCRWAEGPAWFAAGRYLVWSDIPNNRMMRYVEPSGEVSVFRERSNNSNGNTVDNQGRLVTCEHLTRRVTRTEFDGAITRARRALAGQAAQFAQRRRRQVRRQHLVHRSRLRHRRRLRGRQAGAGNRRLPRLSHRSAQRRGRARDRRHGAPERPRLLARRVAALCRRHRRDAMSTTARATSADSASADDGKTLSGGEVFAECSAGLFDGFRLDTEGRIWTSTREGVHVYAPDGALIGKILIPEIVGNVTFGGTKRNRLFIAGTTSLYSMYTFVTGAGNG